MSLSAQCVVLFFCIPCPSAGIFPVCRGTVIPGPGVHTDYAPGSRYLVHTCQSAAPDWVGTTPLEAEILLKLLRLSECHLFRAAAFCP